MRVYVAGPYTGADPAVNVRAAILVGARLLDAGHVPFIPHLTHFWHLVSPRPYEDWMQLDMAWIEVCEAMFRIPGESAGADREVARAKELGIPVFHDLDGLCCLS